MSRRNGSNGEADTPSLVFGRLLARTRKAAGFTQTELAKLTFTDRTLIGKYEKGSNVPSWDFVCVCDEVLKTGGLLAWLWGEIDWYPSLTLHPDSYERRIAMDAKLEHLCDYETGVIPGLLQTEAYARTLFRQVEGASEALVEERVKTRLGRQVRYRAPNGPMYLVLMEETCIRQMLGGPSLMREQMDSLLEVGALPNIHMQVTPFSFPHEVASSQSMGLITMPDGERWVYSEYLDGGHFSADPAVLMRYQRRFDRCRADALSPRESAALIAEVRDEYGRAERSQSDRRALPQRRRQLHRSSPRIHRRHRPGT